MSASTAGSTGSMGTIFSRTLDQAALQVPVKIGAIALAVALTATAAQFTIPLPFTAVPFTLTPLVVMLTGAALGARLGALTQALYLLAGVAGLAVFTPSVTLPPGALRLMGPTGGYLLAYPLAAFATGYLAERGWDRRYVTSVASMLIGLAIIFAGGVAWLTIAFAPSFAAALATGFLPFVIADVLKAAAAAAILPAAWALLGPRHRT
jgi:biotin transport system substrate-specific component